MSLSKNSQIVQDYLSQFGLQLEVVELKDNTKTAQEAADAIGCEIGQIVKSLIFTHENRPLLFLVSGKNSLDVAKVSKELNIEIKKADAGFIKDVTGFSIGGVPPIAHKTKIDTYIDEALMEFEVVWAAAGMPFSVFKLESKILPTLTNGRIIKVN